MNALAEKPSHYLGIDLGSSFTKFVVLDQDGKIAHKAVVPTLSRRREEFDRQMVIISERFNIARMCSTGYGRKNVTADLQKTELICAAAGVSVFYPVRKCILDIGGEDIKIIESDEQGGVVNFFMNDKCSAGTGTFITEIAERSELDISEMSELARRSNSKRVMNSFCTVFAKSEILGWKFAGTPIEEVARGIYLSVVDRICKLPLKRELPLYICGGVIAYHPYLSELLASAISVEVRVVTDPQYTVAVGAAAMARNWKSGTPTVDEPTKRMNRSLGGA